MSPILAARLTLIVLSALAMWSHGSIDPRAPMAFALGAVSAVVLVVPALWITLWALRLGPPVPAFFGLLMRPMSMTLAGFFALFVAPGSPAGWGLLAASGALMVFGKARNILRPRAGFLA